MFPVLKNDLREEGVRDREEGSAQEAEGTQWPYTAAQPWVSSRVSHRYSGDSEKDNSSFHNFVKLRVSWLKQRQGGQGDHRSCRML